MSLKRKIWFWFWCSVTLFRYEKRQIRRLRIKLQKIKLENKVLEIENSFNKQ